MGVRGQLLVLAIHLSWKYPSLSHLVGGLMDHSACLGTMKAIATVCPCQQSNPDHIDHISNNSVQFHSFIKVLDNS
jgi:hypothetical protein